MDMTQQVQPLAALTRPFGNTKLEEPIWFCCTIPNASMHRSDGKKLPFMNGFLKVLFLEDRDYLDNEIDGGSQYLRRANAQEREQARMMEDPLGVIKDNMRPELEKEIITAFSIDDLEALLAKKKAEKDGGVEAGIAQHETNAASAQIANKTTAIPSNESREQRTVRLATEAMALARSGRINPASTEQLPRG